MVDVAYFDRIFNGKKDFNVCDWKKQQQQVSTENRFFNYFFLLSVLLRKIAVQKRRKNIRFALNCKLKQLIMKIKNIHG